MPIPRVENLRIRSYRTSAWRQRLAREWAFIKVALRHFGTRLVLMLVLLLGGAMIVFRFHPEPHPFLHCVYFTWCMVIGEVPADFPEAIALEILYFVAPILGLTVIIEGLVDLSLMIRDRRRCERSWCIMLANSLSNHVVLVGLGRLGFRTYTLLRRLGEDVVVIERDVNNQFLEDVRREGTPLLIGDARREALLEEAHITKAKSIVLATDDDLANLETALDARRLTPGIRVVLRMFDQNMADKIGEGFNIHIAMSQSAISAPTFATTAIEASIVNSFILEDELIVMQQWLVRDSGPLANRTVGELMRDHKITVVERRSLGGARDLFPAAEVKLERGDRVIVQGAYDTVTALQAFAAELTQAG